MGGPSICAASAPPKNQDRKSTRLNSSHTEIYTLSLHDALPISGDGARPARRSDADGLGLTDHGRAEYMRGLGAAKESRSEEHTSELQSHRDLHSFSTRRSSDLGRWCAARAPKRRGWPGPDGSWAGRVFARPRRRQRI